MPRSRLKAVAYATAVVVLAGVSALGVAAPASADTQATVTVAPSFAPNETTSVEVDYLVAVPTAPEDIPVGVVLTVTPAAGATGTVTATAASGSPELSGCAVAGGGTTAACNWVGAAEGSTATLTATIAASGDASGNFTLAYSYIQTVTNAIVPIGTATVAVVPPTPDPVTGSIVASGQATVGQPYAGATATVVVPATAVGTEIPIRQGIEFTRASGTGALVITPPTTGGYTNCVTGADVILCDWAAAPGDTGTFTPSLLFDGESTWTAQAVYQDGNAVDTPVGDPATITVVAAATPTPTPTPTPTTAPGDPGNDDGPGLAESGGTISWGPLGAAVGAVVAGTALLAWATRRRARALD